jgi:hypothetical protein
MQDGRHPRVMVSVGIYNNRIIGQYYDETITSATYPNMLQTFLSPVLEDTPLIHWMTLRFQQDYCAPIPDQDIPKQVDMAEISSWVASQVHGLFLVLGGRHLKSVVYVNRPRNTVELKDNVTSECANINTAMKQRVRIPCFQQFRKCILAVRHQFEHLLPLHTYDAGLRPGYNSKHM